MNDQERADALELARQLTDDPETFREAELVDLEEWDRSVLLLAAALLATNEELQRAVAELASGVAYHTHDSQGIYADCPACGTAPTWPQQVAQLKAELQEREKAAHRRAEEHYEWWKAAEQSLARIREAAQNVIDAYGTDRSFLIQRLAAALSEAPATEGSRPEHA